MRNAVNSKRVAKLLAVLACLLPTASAGAPEAADDSDLWVPALAVFGSALAQPAAQEALAVRSPSARGFGGAGAKAASERWLPALAVIVPVPGGQATAAAAATAGQPGGDLVVTPVLVTAVEVATGVSAEVGAAASEPEEFEPEARDETERWVPALAVISGVLVQGAEGEVSSSDIDLGGLDPRTSALQCAGEPPPPANAQTTRLRCPGLGDDLMVGAFVGGSAELMTPRLISDFGQPRLFFHADAAAYFGPVRDLAKEGSPGPFELPPDERPPIPEVGIHGQGSRTTVEYDPLVVSAGAGVAFTLDVFGRRLRIKPSFEYLREELEVTGIVHRAVRLAAGGGTSPSVFDYVEIRGEESKVFHGIGPGLELEMDTARAGPFMLTLFLSGKAYKMLGDLGVDFSGSVETPALPVNDSATADWSFEKDPWSYRADVGLRFRWLPE